MEMICAIFSRMKVALLMGFEHLDTSLMSTHTRLIENKNAKFYIWLLMMQ